MIKNLMGMAAGALLMLAGSANAATMVDFIIDGNLSSVTVSNVNGGGFLCCDLDADLNAGLDGTSFSLEEGQSSTFDFIDWSPQGVLGSADFEVQATLGFLEPEFAGQQVYGNGAGSFATFFGVVSGGELTWTDLPQTIVLNNGTMFDVAFEGGSALFLGDITTSATVTLTKAVAPVPLPATLPLMAFALGGLVLVSRRRKMIA